MGYLLICWTGTDANKKHSDDPNNLNLRLLIIRTLPYSEEEMVQIIKLRAATEGLTVDETAIQVLGQIGTRFSGILIC